ncbi:hypothetical protein [Halobacillus salinus]|nr:hypothetical protein [Halobacillus salinus]
MEEKPVFYDGSLHSTMTESDTDHEKPLLVTDEMRTSISGNPFYSK